MGSFAWPIFWSVVAICITIHQLRLFEQTATKTRIEDLDKLEEILKPIITERGFSARDAIHFKAGFREALRGKLVKVGAESDKTLFDQMGEVMEPAPESMKAAARKALLKRRTNKK
jgi:hypothetical protein